ncbi:uracil-DNA glycosylase [Stenotrophomonas maltophilia 5BA-I-2]|nr:uracil-DNA glycosylase [Stenotrophomonas maltophilia 5BA-I-2]
MSTKKFVERLAGVSLPRVFNPYADVCVTHDKSVESPLIRKALLLSYLNAVREIDSRVMWMGRDLGYRGGRRTGVALTDEAHLSELGTLYGFAQPQRSTVGPIMAERTATEIWSVLRQISAPPMLWNVFPFHPYVDGDELTNRKFTAHEFAVASELNIQLIRILRIERIVAIGQDAAIYASKLGVEVDQVRHPSYGGTSDFREGMSRIHGLTRLDRQGTLIF